jgi:hypothetical protein
MDSKQLTDAAQNLVDEDLLTDKHWKRILNGHAWVGSCEHGFGRIEVCPSGINQMGLSTGRNTHLPVFQSQISTDL